MIHQTFASLVGLASAMAFTGFAFGLVYFAALRQTAALIAAGGDRRRLSAFTIGRMGVVTILLTLAARLGATPLLATFLGFLVARGVALRAMRRDE